MKTTLILTLLSLSTLNAFADTTKPLKVSKTITKVNLDCEKESNFPLITKTELAAVVENKSAFIVDVNSDESFQNAHVPGAIHFKANQKKFATLLPKDKSAMVVAYCGGPQCTAWEKAATEACKLGYTNVRHFKDGISGWVKN